MKTVKNFARFFALAKQLPGIDKEELVSHFTGGRTTSLRQMSPVEYNTMCNRLEGREDDYVDELKKARSAVLRRIMKLGIDTSDWDNVDNFCLDNRIAGKLFKQIDIDELRALIPKLEAIRRKDRTKKRRGAVRPVEPFDIPAHVLTAMVERAAHQTPS